MANYIINGGGVLLDPPAIETDHEFFERILVNFAKVVDQIEAMIDQLYETESDESYIDRVTQCYKAYGYDLFQEVLFEAL